MLIVEKDIERYLKRKVKSSGGMCLKFPTIHTEGIPDRLVLLPVGEVAFVELKRPEGGRLSEIQKIQISRLRKIGIKVYVIKDKAGVDWLIRKMTKKLPENCPGKESECVFWGVEKGCQLPQDFRCHKEITTEIITEVTSNEECEMGSETQ